MRFKLDENLPREIADDLRSFGHDADTIAEEALTGADDKVVLQAALAADRILMTLDKGIASLLQNPLPQHAGIVLVRPDAVGRTAVATFMRSRLSHLLEMELAHKLTVVTATRIRIR